MRLLVLFCRAPLFRAVGALRRAKNMAPPSLKTFKQYDTIPSKNMAPAPIQNFYKNMAPSPLTPSQSRWTWRVQVFKSGFPVCPPPYHNQQGGEARRWWLHNSRLASLGSASTGVASQVPGHPFYIRTVHFLDSNGPLYLTELVNCTKCCDMIVKGHYSAEHNFMWQSTREGSLVQFHSGWSPLERPFSGYSRRGTQHNTFMHRYDAYICSYYAPTYNRHLTVARWRCQIIQRYTYTILRIQRYTTLYRGYTIQR